MTSKDEQEAAGVLAALWDGMERAEKRANAPLPGLVAEIEAGMTPAELAAVDRARELYGSKRRPR